MKKISGLLVLVMVLFMFAVGPSSAEQKQYSHPSGVYSFAYPDTLELVPNENGTIGLVNKTPLIVYVFNHVDLGEEPGVSLPELVKTTPGFEEEILKSMKLEEKGFSLVRKGQCTVGAVQALEYDLEDKEGRIFRLILFLKKNYVFVTGFLTEKTNTTQANTQLKTILGTLRSR